MSTNITLFLSKCLVWDNYVQSKDTWYCGIWVFTDLYIFANAKIWHFNFFWLSVATASQAKTFLSTVGKPHQLSSLKSTASKLKIEIFYNLKKSLQTICLKKLQFFDNNHNFFFRIFQMSNRDASSFTVMQNFYSQCF